ncbi:MAG: thermonuclease family protein [Rhizobium sp.]|nr:thermonuclease family protein [Rhizobium sp.]
MGQNVNVGGRRLRDAIVGLSMLFLGLLIAAKLQNDNRPIIDGQFIAVDGDTLMQAGARFRLEGIDAPEIGQSCGTDGALGACGETAKLRLADWARHRDFTCRGGERDRYGRLLVRCRAGDQDVNAALVREGFAVSYGDYGREEAAARAERKGLWAGEFERPADWRRPRQPAAEVDEGEHSPGFLAFIGRWLGVN